MMYSYGFFFFFSLLFSSFYVAFISVALMSHIFFYDYDKRKESHFEGFLKTGNRIEYKIVEACYSDVCVPTGIPTVVDVWEFSFFSTSFIYDIHTSSHTLITYPCKWWQRPRHQNDEQKKRFFVEFFFCCQTLLKLKKEINLNDLPHGIFTDRVNTHIFDIASMFAYFHGSMHSKSSNIIHQYISPDT